ncbi:VCBS repeat-containing protein [Hymenobacter sp. BT683]|uniref:VCBS repeat-containing protein n=1 Tax=Hymenobacter jeongseonensis TaxID=2791027 RepID=A0ABS0IHZ4_9BACT|nr:FG-GAP-like repeat-containing protein [Hymenobacter jeongseonensis]MBF9237425.1 VCBS repeat-containing protein [Hymenobacter jeongseonensis]
MIKLLILIFHFPSSIDSIIYSLLMKFSIRFSSLGFGLLLPVALSAQPIVINVSPVANQKAAPRTSNVAATFSEALTVGSEAAMHVFSNQRGGKRTGNSGSTTLSGTTLSFDPAYDFKPGETVFTSITTAARSTNGSLAAPRVFQFTAAATGGNGTFTGGTEVPVGNKPYIVLTADIDGDGDLDLLTPNFTGNSVSIRLNNGTGVFSGTVDTPVGDQPRGLALSDLDGDGDLDIVTANYNDDKASIRFNNGSGVFSGNTELTVGSRPQSVMTADLDGDGDQDLLISNGASSTVSIYINDGNGNFTSNPDVAVGNFPFSLTTADVDNDGDVDLLTGSYQSTTVSVRLNDGNAIFSGTTNLAAGSQPRGVTTADIDGDRDLDLLVVNAFSNSLNIFLNNGSGGFTLNATLAVGNFPGGVTAADIDGDADMDILVPNIVSNTVSVKVNNGSGVFSSGADVQVGSQPYRVAMADIDNDGDLDLLSANFDDNTVSVRFNDVSTLTDLVVSTPENVSGTYRNVTITGPTTGGAGTATLTGTLNVVGTLTVQNGGTLLTGCQPLIGAGNFVLAAGGTLGICDPAGIALTGNTGSVRLTGTRSFSNDASYIYNGTSAQITGGALPSQVRNLTTTNAENVSLTEAVTVVQTLIVASSGDLLLNGHTLTLTSDATGTALVVNSSTGVVQGRTALMERYIDQSKNQGTGYRHYSAPVAGSTIADLATTGFVPVVNSKYNTSATPGQVKPFPTVFAYEQNRVATTTSNYPAFDKGWVSPALTSDRLEVGRGYTVNIAASEKADFVGSLNNGSLTVPLARNAGPTAAASGWALVGNPYPAPLDWRLVTAADRNNLDGAMYVYESRSQYDGNYRSYTNGIGDGNPLIASSQGFFVRVSAGQTTGSLTFRNEQRVTTYSSQASFLRTNADARPLVELRLQGATGPADALFVYAEAGATAGLDRNYDAVKLGNPSGLNLAAIIGNDTNLAINGLPAFSGTMSIPLSINAPAAGRYTLNAAQLLNLSATQGVFLFDAQTGLSINLRTQPSYTFNLTAAQASQKLTTRFVLRFGPAANPLATTGAKQGFEVLLYPNPTRSSFTISLPAITPATDVQATLFNNLGQRVGNHIAVNKTGASTLVDVSSLAQGVYTLQIKIGTTSTTKRVVIQ